MPLHAPLNNVAVIRHLAFEDPGSFTPILQTAGASLHTCDAGLTDLTPAIDSASLLVVLGGPIGVYETDQYPFLADERAALRRRLEAGRPTLGICLGAQLMAAALGARVYPGGTKEIGWSTLELTAAGRAGCLAALEDVPVLHWHGDTFELPDGAELLAGTATYPHQAFSIGRNILGLQFHAEMDPGRIEQWLIGHTCELNSAGIAPSDLRRDTAALPATVQTAGPDMLTAWLGQLDLGS